MRIFCIIVTVVKSMILKKQNIPLPEQPAPLEHRGRGFLEEFSFNKDFGSWLFSASPCAK